MRAEISYCEGYGWHCGRVILWPALLVLGGISLFFAVIIDQALRVATHLPIPLAVGAPLLFGFLLHVRLKRRLNGKPFAFAPPKFFCDDMTTLLISKGHRHFRALLMVECFMWGSVIAAQLAILVVLYTSR